MRITPLDIRQKTFEKNFRGYEKDEVNAFLLTLSQEWERILDENKELRIKLEGIEREVTKLREVENSLYKTLKTAEDTGANVIEQARTAADLHLRESQIQADGLLQEAKSKARDTIEESDSRAKEIVAEMEDRLKLLIENYKMVEASREDLLANFKHIASDALDRVERSRNLTRDFDPDKHLAMVKREARRVAFPNSVDISKAARNEQAPKRDKEVVLEDRPSAIEQPPKKVQSFFDEIG
ncbi:MAG: DivIVA domain-containing protein [Chryseolinea sp.]